MNGKLQLLKLDDDLKNKVIKKLIVAPWPYWIGGGLLAIINILYVLITGEYWGISTNFARWGAWLLQKVGLSTSKWTVWNYCDYYKYPWLDNQTWSNLGIVSGAFLAILLSRQFKWKKIKNKKQLIIALIGGWLMGYGARVAVGCNIGGLYSSISSLAINGWVYLPFSIVGVFIGSKLLMKWLI